MNVIRTTAELFRGVQPKLKQAAELLDRAADPELLRNDFHATERASTGAEQLLFEARSSVGHQLSREIESNWPAGAGNLSDQIATIDNHAARGNELLRQVHQDERAVHADAIDELLQARDGLRELLASIPA